MSKPTDGIEPGDAPTKSLTAGSDTAAGPHLTGPIAGVAGVALAAVGLWGLHAIVPAAGAAGSVGWAVLLLAAFTALGKGITLVRQALAPVTAAVSASVDAIPAVARAVAGIGIGAAGMWWAMRGHTAIWLTQITDVDGWTLPSRLAQVAFIAVAGALLFGGGKVLADLLLSHSGTRQNNQDTAEHAGGQDRWATWWSSHPGLGVTLLAGGAALLFLSGYVVPRVSGWLTGDDPLAALAAITAVLTLALAANTCWWHALSGWWRWANTPGGPGGSTPIGQIYASAGVLALIMFSATAFGMATLASYLPATANVASADPCGDRCGGGGNGQGSYGPDAGNFRPPQVPGQMPDYQGGINQPPLDQNGGVSIYNPSAGQGGPQQAPQNMGPQMSGQHAAHGEALPNYGPWQPDAQLPGQAPVQQAPQPVQQAPAQQPAQVPQNPAGQQPVQQAPEQVPQQAGPQQPQGQPGQQPQPQQVQKQPEQPPTKPDTPTKSPIDPTDLAVAATRRGSQQAGQQAAQQGTAQAVSKSSQIATQMSGTATNMSGPAKPAPPTPTPGQIPGFVNGQPPPGPPNGDPNLVWWKGPNGWMTVPAPQSGGPGAVWTPNNAVSPPTTPTSQPSPPTQSPNLGPEIRDMPEPKDPTELLHKWADLGAKIDAHNAKVYNPSNPAEVAEYEAEYLELNSKLLELGAELTNLGIPYTVSPAPNR
ncbi:hypothetical protein [Mycobacteroides franklinii]|uniref:Uncharacterized protein n=1 Tax=Mycobacteroides franklinii TaxID=948102 RepID=A0A4R8R9L4_9MYCO|nr:hypothetical protein [Mycobacteroides franklinii]TDZ42798.1 hypothetical protein CCUG64054_02847 [Mycobacteroides franklinii]TDZ52946.1 hypothetical protein CCUG63697_01432 [Mycobacteroides franklinii]TDZ56353.1 hypothetical protein CCUG63696_02849 [Mycobacteroides franklinii]TDZ63294.1 hypothetical protein CCUG63695_02774 [Mycobacteroides franklinii]TDZ69691.1 hypothetical protein CCUG64056_02847 [Mycobacteroides franklinii]